MKYRIKKSRKLIKKLLPFVSLYLNLQDDYYRQLNGINDKMANATGIKDIEIFESDSGWGIGNASRTMQFIHDADFENEMPKLS